MARQHWSGDLAGEQKIALERLIERRVGALDALGAVEIGAQGGDPNNVSALDSADQPVFTTGYSGGETTLAFTWNMSHWGDADLWTA